MLYLVDTGYACAGVEFEAGRVVRAAPISRWMLGKEWAQVQSWKKIKAIFPAVGGGDSV